ncbi:MAG: hypothetical protein JXA22_02120 [Candidatus Thermoplasmatota archaeon]|nr:hypothetical protein [Candidatus Thermoplasmatota archaeon]
MRFPPVVPTIVLVICLLSSIVSAEDDFTIEEDSSLLSEESVNEILGLDNDTVVSIYTYDENITISLVDGHLNIMTAVDWNGITLIGYNYIEDHTLVDGAWTLNVTPVNDAPEIINITLSGDPDNLENPVTYSVVYMDADGDEIMVSWSLGEDDAGEGVTVTRYVFPDQNDLTVVVDDGNGGSDTMNISIHTIPPKGWGDEPDNTRNRIIFWSIFGSAGLILLVAVWWVVLYSPGTNDPTGANKEEKVDGGGPKEGKMEDGP